jgi:hypothetical protein
MRHAVAEDMCVYPAIEDQVPNGKEEVEHDKRGHDEIVKLISGWKGGACRSNLHGTGAGARGGTDPSRR